MRKTGIRLTTALFLCLSALLATAQVKTKIWEGGLPENLKHSSPAVVITVPAPPNLEEVKRSGFTNENSTEYKNRFALPVAVDYNLVEVGRRSIEGAEEIYAVRIYAKGALNLSLRFSEFGLSPNARLRIATSHELTDSIDSRQNNQKGTWVTRVYQGDFLNLILFVPKEEAATVRLRVGIVNFGVVPIGGGFFGNPGASATCNINALCPAGNGWEAERRSVALIVANGFESCTGNLIMNTCGSNTPYLLTANHCLTSDVRDWVFQFQTWSTTCTPNGAFREDLQFNGSQLRARNAATDFALLELTQTPPANSGLTYAGWDRTANPAAFGATLHHPRGDLMKVSIFNQQAIAVPWLGGPADHWRVAFNEGIVQFGSSGSGLFNQNRRIVGQLTGNQNNFCGQGAPDACWCIDQIPSIGEYGRFDLSWAGGGNSDTRLSDWLDPSNTGAMTTNTSNVANLFNNNPANYTISGPLELCGTATYTISPLPPCATVIWSSQPQGAVLFSPTGPTNNASTTATGITGGSTTITATIAFQGRTVVVNLPSVFVGTASPQYSICGFSPNQGCRFGRIVLSVTRPYPSGTEFRYFRNGVLVGGPTTSTSFNFGTAPCGVPVDYSVTATTVCGTSQPAGQTVAIECEGGGARITASPNPAKNEVNVALSPEWKEDNDSHQPSNGPTKTNEAQTIIVAFDAGTNTLAKQWTFGEANGKTYNLNLNGLRKGVYIVQVRRAGKAASTKIIVE